MTEFVLRKANIYTSSGQVIDIRDIVAEYNFFESLDSCSTSVELTVVDMNNIIENYNIFGQEKLVMEFGNSTENLYELDFYIFKISSRSMYQRKQAYIIHAASKELLLNESKRVSRRFKNIKAEKIVESLLKNVLESKNKTLNYDVSIYNINFLSPNWRVFDLISWLQKRTVSKDFKNSSGYLFYETLDNNFYFKSIDKLLSKSSRYNYPFVYLQSNVDKSTSLSEDFRIRRFSLPEVFDVLSHSRLGTYAHTQMNLDINNRKFYSSFLSADDYIKNSVTLNPQKPYRSSGVFNVTQNPTRIVFKPYMSDTWSDSTKTLNTDFINTNISKSIFRHNLFNLNRLEIEIKGNFDIRCGDIVDVLIPSPESTSGAPRPDERLSGKYLIFSAKHSLTSKTDLTTYLSLVRDTYGGDNLPDTIVESRVGQYL